jgi:hypothetical protein
MKSSRTAAPASPAPISSRKSETPLPPLEFRRDKPPDPRVAFSLIGRPGARLIPNDGPQQAQPCVCGLARGGWPALL